MSFRPSETCKFPLYHLLVSWSVGWLAGKSVCIKKQLVFIWLTNFVLTFASCFVLDFFHSYWSTIALTSIFVFQCQSCNLFSLRELSETNWYKLDYVHTSSFRVFIKYCAFFLYIFELILNSGPVSVCSVCMRPNPRCQCFFTLVR